MKCNDIEKNSTTIKIELYTTTLYRSYLFAFFVPDFYLFYAWINLVITHKLQK